MGSKRNSTTFAKLNRESRMREKRADKEARKAARKLGATDEAADPASQSRELEDVVDEADTGTSGI